ADSARGLERGLTRHFLEADSEEELEAKQDEEEEDGEKPHLPCVKQAVAGKRGDQPRQASPQRKREANKWRQAELLCPSVRSRRIGNRGDCGAARDAGTVKGTCLLSKKGDTVACDCFSRKKKRDKMGASNLFIRGERVQ
ncbi:hypothetical protein TGRUB_361850, partial [Toxoplasma gondii RUB]